MKGRANEKSVQPKINQNRKRAWEEMGDWVRPFFPARYGRLAYHKRNRKGCKREKG